jgi:CheY-like chemotaxis protein
MAKTIAVIDDSPIVLSVAADALGGAGFAVNAMTEPRRSELTAERAPDLVLVDVNMREAYGDDVVQFLRQRWGVTAPIYLYSSLPERELAERARAAGADGYVSKAWGTEGLVSAVGRALASRAASEPAEATIFARFAQRCRERADRFCEALDQQAGGEAILSRLRLDLHDWLGESQLLGLEPVGGVVEVLLRTAQRWQGSRVGVQAAQLRSWLGELAELSASFALEAPDRQTVRRLEALRSTLEQEAAASDTPTGEHPPVDVSSPSRRILIFDDSPIVVEALSSELRGRGHVVTAVTGLQEFNARLADFDPEIIFLDVNMPEINGETVCRQIRSRPELQSTPIVFLSSLSDVELARLAARAGASGHFSKQHGLDRLVAYLDRLLSEVIF